MQPTPPLASSHSTSRWDILWYLLAGYGGYTALMTLLLAALSMNQNTWLLLQAGFQVIFLGGVVWLVGERRGRFSWAELGLFPPRWRRAWFGWAAAGGLALALFNLLTERMALWLEHGSFAELAPLGTLPWGDVLLVLVCTGVLIPLAEELFFRGAVYHWLEHRYGKQLAMFGCATLFAVTRATFFNASSLLHVIQSLVLGLVVTYAMQRTRSLWLPIALHVLAYILALVITLVLALF